jgi:hypothetical protein
MTLTADLVPGRPYRFRWSPRGSSWYWQGNAVFEKRTVEGGEEWLWFRIVGHEGGLLSSPWKVATIDRIEEEA